VNFALFDNSTLIQPPLLEVKNLSQDFGGLRALAKVSFRVMPGEIAGVIGPNGAGKTTLFALLSGFLSPTHGEISFMETPIAGMRPDKLCHLGIARTFQVVRPFLELLVKWGLNPLLSLPLAVAIAAGVSCLSYRFFLQRIRTTAELNTLILTFGVGIFLSNLYLQLWSADIRNISVDWMENPLKLAGIYISLGEIVTFAISFLGVLALHSFLRHTKIGKAIRTTAIDRDAASLAGINVERVDLLAVNKIERDDL